jgi:hypothetical protein
VRDRAGIEPGFGQASLDFLARYAILAHRQRGIGPAHVEAMQSAMRAAGDGN